MTTVGLPAVDHGHSSVLKISEAVTIVCIQPDGNEKNGYLGDLDGVLFTEVAPEAIVDTAGSLWHAGIALSAYLSLDLDSKVLQGAKVCELGAGCCLPGLVTAMLGARSVCLTDLAVNMSHMSSIIEKNEHIASCHISSAVVEFGVPSTFDTNSFTIILGADIGFDIGLHSKIKETLLQITDTNTKIILCEEVRWKDIFDWYIEELETSFSVSVHDAPAVASIGNGRDIKLLLLRRM